MALRSFKFASLLLPFTLCALNAIAADVEPFKAYYHADLGSVSADAVRELKRLNDDHWQLSQTADNFFASVVETSEFTNTKDQLVSARYEYQRKAFGSKRHALLAFDWNNQKVTNDVEGKPWSYSIEEGTLDKLNFQLQLRIDLKEQQKSSLNPLKKTFEYAVADGGVLKIYRFLIIGEEQIDTKLGLIDAIKVKRLYGNKNDRETWLWFSKEHDYLLVKYLQTKDKGKKKTELVITKIESSSS